ncbi:WD domain, G-beta repeat [Geosmithia morbida]|uniref:WD domain, G-beta repeat n=1 Tax=Geosmithia morbida TaxID=1094350 RepID=A0A9P4YZZ6_9HYPO|nr:WD domain, G-beta repeat [Geosmithia morbida]KAF4124897.1 WD domain, G-beta repeat [Geosmithia morbida]
MYNLTPRDEHVFPDDTWVLDLTRTPSGGLVSISSDQSLTLFDPTSLGRGPAARLSTNHGNLTTLGLFGESVVCTAGEDGSVGVWDLRGGKSVGRFNGEYLLSLSLSPSLPPSLSLSLSPSLPLSLYIYIYIYIYCMANIERWKATDAPIMSMACNAQTSTIALGTELTDHQASVVLWDMRSSSLRAAYHDLHSDDVTTLSYHPSRPDVVLSGSTDGLVSVHDTSIPDEDDMTVQTLNLGASVHRAGFLGSSSLVAALSHDERFALYDVSDAAASGDALRDFGDVRGALDCRYVVDVVPKVDGTGAILGVGDQERGSFQLVFLAAQDHQWTLDRSTGVGLPGAHGEDIVRSFCFFDENQLVFTGGEDGKIKAWCPGS